MSDGPRSMAIPLKSPRDIDAMRRAGTLLSAILDEAISAAVPEARTRDLDALISARIAEAGAQPVMRQTGFPGASSITLNEEVAHAPPGPRVIRDGDIVTIDAALALDGWCADAARVVGGSETSDRIIGAAAAASRAAIDAIRPGRLWSEVAAAARSAARSAGCSIVIEYAGHGIGRALQEAPAAPFLTDWSGNGPAPPQDFVLRPGMVLTVEPVLVLGRPVVLGLDDGWTVVTADRSAAAHLEETVAVTGAGALVLTAL